MKKLIRTALLAVFLTFAACTAMNSSGIGATAPAEAVFAAESAYDAAAHLEASWIASGVPNAATVAEIKRLDDQAYNALVPLRNAAQAGGANAVIDQAEIDAANAAVTALGTYLTTHGAK